MDCHLEALGYTGGFGKMVAGKIAKHHADDLVWQQFHGFVKAQLFWANQRI